MNDNEILKIASGITTPIALFAFIGARWLHSKVTQNKHQLETIEKLPPKEQTKLLDDCLSRYKLSAENLTREQKVDLLKHEMNLSDKRHSRVSILIAVVFVVGLIIGVLAFKSGATVTIPDQKMLDEARKEESLIPPHQLELRRNETDPEVVDVLSESSDPERLIQNLLDRRMRASDQSRTALNRKLAVVAIENGDFENAKVAIEALLSNSTDNMDGLNYRGLLFLHQKRFDDAEADFKHLMDVASKSRNDIGRIVALVNLSLVYSDQFKFDEAENLLKEAAALAEKIPEFENTDCIQQDLGLVIRRKNLPLAEEFFLRSLELAERRKDTEHVVLSLLAIADIETAIGELDKAEEKLRHVELLCNKLGKKSLMVTCLIDFGQLFNARKEFKKSFDYYTKALDLAEKLSKNVNAELVGRINYALAQNAISQSNFEDADGYYRRAIGAYRTCSLPMVGVCYFEMGTLNLNSGDIRSAITNFSNASDKLKLAKFTDLADKINSIVNDLEKAL